MRFPGWLDGFFERTDMTALLRLAIPMVTVQTGMMAMGVVDTVMIGRFSPEGIAAVALGNMYFFAVGIFGIGVLMAVDPVMAQAVGAADRPAVARAFQRGILLAGALTVPVSLGLMAAEPILAAVRQPIEVVPLAGAYDRIMIVGVFPFLAFTVFRQTLQAMGRMRILVLVILLSNGVNALLNWMLIFGHVGFPALGVPGSAWATSLSRLGMAVGVLVGAKGALVPLVRPWRPESFRTQPLWRMVRIGVPIGAQFQLEFGAFGGVALLMGWLGTTAVAAHQVAINLASFTFMVPFGIGAAVSVLVGQAVGAGDHARVRGSAHAALVLGAGFMSVTCVMFLLMPYPLARMYTPDAAVLALAAALLPLAGVFQVFDGIQVVAIGILRGIGDTRAPFLINILGFWMVGIPISLLLGFRAGLGPRGLWWGLVAGLMVVAVVLLVRVFHRLRQEHERLIIDGDGAPTLEVGAGVLNIGSGS